MCSFTELLMSALGEIFQNGDSCIALSRTRTVLKNELYLYVVPTLDLRVIYLSLQEFFF